MSWPLLCISTSKLRCEREAAKRRTLLVRQLEDNIDHFRIRIESVNYFFLRTQKAQKVILLKMTLTCFSDSNRAQECHTKAWKVVTDYMDQNLRVFTGKSASADSVVMPAVHSWIAESLNDIAEVKSKNDHAIIGWLCLPTAGVIGAQKWDFFVTFVCNFLHAHPVNGIVLIVHSNRASQMKSSPKVERSCMGST